MMEGEGAIVLLSGGLDSATTLAIASREGYAVYALTFRYGQRHAREIEAAKTLAEKWGVKRHLVMEINPEIFAQSALTSAIPVPKGRREARQKREIPVTYVPARNTVFLSLALAWAEVMEISDIFIGVNAVDYSGYPDCRPEFVAAFERMANLALKATVEGRLKIKIRTPLINLSKAEIIRRGYELGVDFRLTHSCYDPSPDGYACGECDSCLLRKKGFLEAGIPDPTVYIR
ncbi:MAG TPA: 7-cyano-7-deazaguanine synthase QueC [Syntrophales bacterium]|nr:7-cyano-7-deazaguanine synthase QueC [Syntrophales bacterium]HOL59659.1 7-cyano-7-deazaguanine synthase QueC [Syntrophales bacterium]HPO35805.1 7-cyano-7-deazaguanine synthase QueC [Syntrophales bacterium]